MSQIVFVDPGYGKMWETDSGESPLTYVESVEYNPYSGVAFTGKSVKAACTVQGTSIASLPHTPKRFADGTVDFPTIFANNDTAEIRLRVKFSVFCKNMESGGTFALGHARSLASSDGIQCGISISKGSCYYLLGDGESHTGSISDGFHNISIAYSLCKVTSGYYPLKRVSTSNTSMNYTGTKYIPGNSPVFLNQLIVKFPSAGQAEFYVSNVICRLYTSTTSAIGSPPAVIPLHTQLMFLDLGEPEDITFKGDPDITGGYIGYSSGDKLLQTIDATDVIKRCRKTANCEAVFAYGNPAYKDVDFSKSVSGVLDGKIKAGYGTIPTETNKNYWAMFDGRALSELHGKQIGWEID